MQNKPQLISQSKKKTKLVLKKTQAVKAVPTSKKKNVSEKTGRNKIVTPDNAGLRKLKNELRDIKERLHVLSEAAEEGIVIHHNGVIIDANEAFARLFGYELSEMIGMNAKKLATAETWKLIRKNISREYDKSYEGIGKRKDSSTFICSMVGKPYKYKGRALRVSVFRDVTKSRQAEQALRESEKQYRLLTEKMSDIVWIADMNLNTIYVSPSVENILGFSQEERMHQTLEEHLTPHSLSLVSDALSRELAIEERGNADLNRTLKLELEYYHKDGSTRWMELVISGIRNERGVLTGIHGVSRNISDRKKAEEALRQSEEKYRNILENMQDPYYEVDFAGNFTFFNNAAWRHIGYSKEELLRMNFKQYMDKENAKNVFQAFNNVYRTGEPTKGFDWEIIKKDGTKIYIETSVSLRKDSADKPIGFKGIVRDITERKRAESDLKKSEEKYRLLADHVKDAVWLMDVDLNVTYISPSVEKLLGYTLDEIRKIPLDKLLTSASFKEAMDIYLMEKHKVISDQNYISNRALDLELVKKDGRLVCLECLFTSIRDENGVPASFLGEGRDITDRKTLEQKLLFEQQWFRSLIEHSSDIIVVVNLEGTIIYINPAVEQILGYKIEERIGHKGFELIHPDDIKVIAETFDTLTKAKTPRVMKGEMRLRHKDGSWRICEGMGSNLIYNNVVEAVIVNYRDITERKKAEETLHQTLENLRQSIKVTIQVLGVASEAKDPYTAGHHRRVETLACAIAREKGLSDDIIEGIRLAASIHDIGKISVPAEILSKPTKLNHLEFSLIKTHAQAGYEMLKHVESPWPLAEIIYQHHERMDGSGYPRNLKRDEILLEARILAVADVLEAMSFHRPYRPQLGIEIALEEIEKNKGILYDEDVVDACLRLFREKGYQLI